MSRRLAPVPTHGTLPLRHHPRGPAHPLRPLKKLSERTLGNPGLHPPGARPLGPVDHLGPLLLAGYQCFATELCAIRERGYPHTPPPVGQDTSIKLGYL
jgi:hypothetical protein